MSANLSLQADLAIILVSTVLLLMCCLWAGRTKGGRGR